MSISLPYSFSPRGYQKELFIAREKGYKRLYTVWHRRAGKDKAAFNLVVREAMQRVGNYYYIFPYSVQGKRSLWNHIDSSGTRMLSHVPDELLYGRPNSQEMVLTLVDPRNPSKPGSTIQVVGADDPDRIRGTPAVGWVFSEYAWTDPSIWTSIALPVLRENNGWALFNTTPFGRNHAFHLWESIQDDPRWFKSHKTVYDTMDDRGLTKEEVDEEIEQDKREGMEDEKVQQEYFLSWNANAEGFYYMAYINEAREQGRISNNVPFFPDQPVDVYFDIGRGDNTALWFAQVVGQRINLLHYYANRSKGAEHYADYLANIARERGYIYGQFQYPWDANSGNWATDYTPVTMMERLYPNADHIVQEKLPRQIGINAVRQIFPICHFHEKECEKGISALENYRRQYDDKRKEFKEDPYHDWASDGADSFRYLALGISVPEAPIKAERNKRIRRALNKVPNRRRRNWMAN